jgi:hypothetical protein
VEKLPGRGGGVFSGTRPRRKGERDDPRGQDTWLGRGLVARWIERVGFVFQAEWELRFIVRGAGNRGRETKMVGSLLRLTTCAEELAEAHVAVGELGVLIEQTLAESLRLIELTGVNQVDDVVGELVDRLAVVGHWQPRNAGHRGWWWWSVAALLVAGGDLGGLVVGQAALLVFLATAARTGLVASDLGHGFEMPLLKLFGDATF